MLQGSLLQGASVSGAVVTAAAVLLVTWLLQSVVRNLYFHPLSKFPGPRIAAATRLYEFFWDVVKTRVGGSLYLYEIDRLHDQYGPIVRISPKELHIRDVQYYEKLYALHEVRDKAPYLADIFGNPLALFGTVKHDVHKIRRHAANPYFSKASVLKLEGTIISKVAKMCDSIARKGKAGQTIIMNNALIAVTIDVLTHYTFNKCANALDHEDFDPRWTLMMTGVSEAVQLGKHIPGIVPVIQSIPVWIVRLMDPVMAGFLDLQSVIQSYVDETFEQRAQGKQPSKQSEADRDADHDAAPSKQAPTIFQELLDSSLPEHEKSAERFAQEGLGFVAAGSETTGVVLLCACYYVVRSPDIARKLKAELDTVMPDARSIPGLRVLEPLPYLTAVIKEALRISVPIASRLAVLSPAPLEYEAWVIPPNTQVSMSTRDALLNPDAYPDPLTFDPERWLGGKATLLMERCLLPFNRGSRVCVGQNLAMADIYFNTAALFRRFRFTLDNVDFDRDVKPVRENFVSKPTLQSKGIRVRVAEEYA